MLTFVFIIPLRNPALSSNWDCCVKLALETLTSASAQEGLPRNSRLKIVMVCKDFPDSIEQSFENVEILRENFPDPRPSWTEQHEDKYLKIKRGLVYSRQYAPAYFMKLDADDLISNRLVSYVLKRDNRRGYLLNRGYKWVGSSRYLNLNKRFHRTCGSSNILYATPNDLPFSMQDKASHYDLMNLGHNIVEEVFLNRKAPLEEIPFPAAIYRIQNGENLTSKTRMPEDQEPNRPNWKFYVGKILCFCQRILTRQGITSKVRQEFTIKKSCESE